MRTVKMVIRPSLIETLVDEEIRRMVADAIREQECLWTAAAVAQILRTYPTCGLNRRELTNRLIVAASKAGVAVEIDQGRAA